MSSGFISSNYHNYGEERLADRGFTLINEFATTCGLCLLLQSFIKGKWQLATHEVEESQKIASIQLQIHIEWIIGLIKYRFTILKGPFPVTMLKSLIDKAHECAYSSPDTILTVTAVLTNQGDGIVSNILQLD